MVLHVFWKGLVSSWSCTSSGMTVPSRQNCQSPGAAAHVHSYWSGFPLGLVHLMEVIPRPCPLKPSSTWVWFLHGLACLLEGSGFFLVLYIFWRWYCKTENIRYMKFSLIWHVPIFLLHEIFTNLMFQLFWGFQWKNYENINGNINEHKTLVIYLFS